MIDLTRARGRPGPGPLVVAALEEGWWSTTIATIPAVTTTTTATIATSSAVFGSLRARYVLTGLGSLVWAHSVVQYAFRPTPFLVSGRTRRAAGRVESDRGPGGVARSWHQAQIARRTRHRPPCVGPAMLSRLNEPTGTLWITREID